MMWTVRIYVSTAVRIHGYFSKPESQRGKTYGKHWYDSLLAPITSDHLLINEISIISSLYQ